MTSKLIELLKRIEVTGPDADNLFWLQIRGDAQHGGALFNLGHKMRFAVKAAAAFEEERKAALAEAAFPHRPDIVEWAVTAWNEEVKNRPLVNVHRSRLDKTWRKVISRAGGDPEALLGPNHETLVAAQDMAR